MLTNKNFVRSIAMLLALLMVTALCLTGCGNKAADEALTKAEEAKTLAEDVNAALAGYLKTADAEATVKALVDAALADGAATKAEIAELSAKLANYVTLAQVEALITEKVAANAVAGAVTKAEIEEILSKYYTKEEVDAKFNNLFGEFTAEQVLAMLKNAMTLTEWDGATEIVLDTIRNLQTLLNSLKYNTYTQANMAKVNEALAIFDVVAFKDADKDGRLDELKLQTEAIDKIAKELEYTLLRQPTIEDATALKNAVAAAVAVPTFESSFAALIADLYGLGQLVTVGSYDASEKFTAEKYGDLGGYYHETYVAGKSDVQNQVVTLADKAGFHAFAQAHDALLAEYYADNTYATVDGTTTGAAKKGWIAGLTAYNLYEVTATAYGSTTKTLETLALTAEAPAGGEKLGQTMLYMANVEDAAYLTKVYQNKAVENEVIKYPLYEAQNLFQAAAAFDVTTSDWKKTNMFDYIISDLDLEQNDNFTWANTYSMLWYQLNYVQQLADFANDMFEGGVTTALSNPFNPGKNWCVQSFLEHTIYMNDKALNVPKDYEDVTDAEFLAALKDYMCEPIAYVTPTFAFDYYLLDHVDPTVKGFKRANGQAYDPNFGGFDKWELYEQMMDKSFDLLWAKYRDQANEWIAIIVKDYISIVYEAIYNTPGEVYGVGAVAAANTDTAVLAGLMNKTAPGLTIGEPVDAADLTAGFVKAFVEGTDLGANTPYGKLGLAKKFKTSNLNRFYLNNGAAEVNTTKIGDAAASTGKVFANPVLTISKDAENIRQSLTRAKLYTSLEIAKATMQADKEACKADGRSVREAFYPRLLACVEDLDEIYDRFLLEDYKKMVYNDMTVKAEKIVTFYNKGVADAALTAAMERFLTGVADLASFETGIEVKKDATTKKITSLTYKANDAEKTLTNADLLNKVKAVEIAIYANSASGEKIEKIAKAARQKIDGYAAEATATIENVAVKTYYLNYLWEARGDIYDIFMAYDNYTEVTFPTSWTIMDEIADAMNSADDQISILEFFHNRGGYALADYKTSYISEVLSLIADKDNLHVALLSGKTIDQIVALDLAGQQNLAATTFTTELKKVKSSQNLTWVTGDFSPYTTHTYIGELAVDMDEILNTIPNLETTYKKNNTVVRLYED